ncbi:MAG: hypothetical protein H3C54_01565 [Taibaiella sp.]|nr:hypothetical protein [Taibaiella sp.]
MKCLFAAALILLTACDKKIECPGFDTNNLKLMPYQDNDVITFTDGVKDISFTVGYKEYSEAYRDECGPDGMLGRICPDCSTKAEMIAYSDETRNNAKRLHIILETTTHYGKTDEIMIFQVLDFIGDGTSFSGLNANSNYYHDSTIHALNVNGKSYENVRVHTLDTLNSWSDFDKKHIWRVYLTNMKGIIGFSDRQTKSTYFFK